MTPGEWCADFVNGALKSAGIKGVNSSIANSFMGWGNQVMGDIAKGDVLVEHRGKGVGRTGGHAGIATGRVQHDARTGHDFVEMISGNHGNRVGRSWVDRSAVMARRSEVALAGKPGTYSGGQDLGDGIKGKPFQSAAGLAKESPAERLAKAAPPRPAAGGMGGGSKVHAPITIHNNGDAEHTANQVQRRIQDSTNQLAHDISFESV